MSLHPQTDDTERYRLRDPRAFAGLLAFRGLTQADLAREIGLTRQHISYVAKAKRRASAVTADRIARHLGVHPAELFEVDSIPDDAA